MHGILDRVMQVLEVPYSEEAKDGNCYYIQPSEGMWGVLVLFLQLKRMSKCTAFRLSLVLVGATES